MQKVIEKIKELTELVGQLNKLMIKLISLAGWIMVLIHIFNN